MSTVQEVVKDEVTKVYSNGSNAVTRFRASHAIPIGVADEDGKSELLDVLNEIDGYNNFDPETAARVLQNRFVGCDVIIGREGSVVVYIIGFDEDSYQQNDEYIVREILWDIEGELDADEVDLITSDMTSYNLSEDAIRIWWD